MAGDIQVILRGGTYRLASTLAFTNAAGDSGTLGHHVIYTNYAGEVPVLSGAVQVTGWSQYDSSKNIWHANVAAGTASREFYVNGIRGDIARGPTNPPGWTINSTGYTAPDSSLAAWPDVAGAEIVSESQWLHRSCPIASAQGTQVTMAQPCFANSTLPYDFPAPVTGVNGPIPLPVTWVQNAYELLSTPGQWYLRSATGDIYYIPRPGEVMSAVDAELPVLTTLVSGSGTAAAPLTNLTFSGLTFSYATWLDPSSTAGFSNAFAGWSITGSGYTSIPYQNLSALPGEVSFNHATGILFSGDLFTRMGGPALYFDRGVQNSQIQGSRFVDVAADAIELGRVDTADEQPAAGDQVTGITINDNVIDDVSTAYRSNTGIRSGYTSGLNISHNFVADVPYDAIAFGEGFDTSYSSNNAITNNEVSTYMQLTTIADGGGIYTTTPFGSASARSVVSGNYLHDDSNKFAEALYFDALSAYVDVSGNVVDTILPWVIVQNCCNLQAMSITVTNNYATTSIYSNPSPPSDTVISGNQQNLTSFPAAALAIEANAGLEAGFSTLMPAYPINDSDHAIYYGGSGWAYATSRGQGDFFDDIHATGTAQDFVGVFFNGSGISLLNESSALSGPLEVYIDGIDQGTVNPPQSAATQAQQLAYSIDGLIPGSHVLELSNKTAALLSVDGFTKAPARAVVNDDGSAVAYYGGGWTHVTGRGLGDFNDDVHATSTAGSFVVLSFTGSGASLICPGSSNPPSLLVYIDEINEGVVVPPTRTGNSPQQLAYIISGLAPGAHAIGFSNTTAVPFDVDAFTIEPNRIIFNDTSDTINYSGTWGYSANRGLGDFSDDVHYTYSAGSSVTFAFTGSAVTLLNQRSTSTAALDVYVDGLYQGIFTPPTANGTASQQVAYSIEGLHNGNHSLKLVNRTAALLTVDAFTVR